MANELITERRHIASVRDIEIESVWFDLPVSDGIDTVVIEYIDDRLYTDPRFDQHLDHKINPLSVDDK